MKYTEMFEEWYNKNVSNKFIGVGSFEYFINSEYPAMQQGVWREFFESKGIWINVTYRYEWKVYIPVVTYIEEGFYKDLLLQMAKDYNNAFNTAIETAGKLLEGVE